MAWEQVEREFRFDLVLERDTYTTLDRDSRFVCAVQTGKNGPGPAALTVTWRIDDGEPGRASMAPGMVSVDFAVSALAPGRHQVVAELLHDTERLARQTREFVIEPAPEPATSGTIGLVLPLGIPQTEGTYPLTGGVPFPRGALRNPQDVRILDNDRGAVPA
jgi:hypothetical protein